jgi:hypothetical protein
MREAHWGKEGPARLFNFELQRGSKCKEGMLNQHPLKPPDTFAIKELRIYPYTA